MTAPGFTSPIQPRSLSRKSRPRSNWQSRLSRRSTAPRICGSTRRSGNPARRRTKRTLRYGMCYRLRKLGFLNVRYHHGKREFGRDVLFARFTEFQELEHWGAQIKFGDVSGGAQSEVDGMLGQIDDAFKMPFHDLYTRQQQRISKLASSSPVALLKTPSRKSAGKSRATPFATTSSSSTARSSRRLPRNSRCGGAPEGRQRRLPEATEWIKERRRQRRRIRMTFSRSRETARP